MNRIKNSLIALGGLSLLISVVALTTPRPIQGQSGDPVGPTKPVKVVNTSSEPVPVTGTITGNVNIVNTPTVDARQSGPWTVGIAGTPTVKIDPAGNTVQCSPAVTFPIFLSTSRPVPHGSSSLGTFDVGQFSKIRILAKVSSVAGDVRFSIVENSLAILTIDEFGISHQTTSRVYEVPGSKWTVNVENSGDDTYLEVSIFGN